MNLNEAFPVSPGKLSEVLERLKSLKIPPSEIEEQFILGGGPGGTKRNKTANCVLLRYRPLGIVVRCQADRQRSVNRFLALRELVDRIEEAVSPGSSRRLRQIERLRSRKARAGRRARARHRKGDAISPEEPPAGSPPRAYPPTGK